MSRITRTFQHRDGRVCYFYNFDGQWRHWDHPEPEPGPRDAVRYLCEREHDMEPFKNQPGDKFQHPGSRSCTYNGTHWTYGDNLIICRRSHPGDSSAYKPVGQWDRGDFGMPTLGISSADITGLRMGPGMVVAGPSVEFHGPVGPKVERVQDIIYEALNLYSRKAAGYKGVDGDTADHLGARGQFADINRKFWRIKAMLWDEVVPMYPDAGAGENVEEILMDFIGHAALTIDFLRQAQGHGEEGPK